MSLLVSSILLQCAGPWLPIPGNVNYSNKSYWVHRTQILCAAFSHMIINLIKLLPETNKKSRPGEITYIYQKKQTSIYLILSRCTGHQTYSWYRCGEEFLMGTEYGLIFIQLWKLFSSYTPIKT